MTVQSSSAALRAGLVTLTPRERDIFNRLHASLGEWLDTKDEVAEPILSAFVSRNTFKTHLCHLRKKLAGTPWVIESQYKAIRIVRRD